MGCVVYWLLFGRMEGWKRVCLTEPRRAPF
jgi:hypothetical protein